MFLSKKLCTIYNKDNKFILFFLRKKRDRFLSIPLIILSLESDPEYEILIV